MTTLNDLPIGQTATIDSVGGTGALRQHLLDMGLVTGTAVTMVKRAPLGDPIEVRVRSYELTLRQSEASEIIVTDFRDNEPTELEHTPDWAKVASITIKRKSNRYPTPNF